MAINPSTPEDPNQMPPDQGMAPPDMPEGAPDTQAMPPQSEEEMQHEDHEQDEHEAPLADDEEYASDAEMQLVYKVMSHVFDTIKNGANDIKGMLQKSPAIAKTIGDLSFQILGEIFLSAAQSGEQIPVDIFMMQGGAAYQTIDAIADFAESVGVEVKDADRQNALGYAMEDYQHSRFSQGNIDPEEVIPHIEEMQNHGKNIPPSEQMMPMKPLAGAIQHGLLGGMRNA